MKTLCVGEILWDIIGGQAFLGGAPLNAAAHLARLGAESWLLSAVGNDERGRKAIETMAKAGVRPDYVAVLDGFDTGTALVFPEQEGSGRFLLPENTAYDQTALPKEWMDAPKEDVPLGRKVPAFDALVFGSLASFRSESVKRGVCALARALPSVCRLYDVNLRLSYYDRALVETLLSLCTVFKVNDEEAAVLGELLFGKSLSFLLFAAEILAAFPACEAVLVTKGGQGAEAYVREGGGCSAPSRYFVPGESVVVADTVGAGDAFSAAFLAVWMKTGDISRALRAGNAAGAFTASRAGAFPAYDDVFVREKIWRV